MKKFIVSSEKNIVADSGWDESDYFGEYTVLEKKISSNKIIFFNTEEEAKKSLTEHLNEDGNLSVKTIEI